MKIKFIWLTVLISSLLIVLNSCEHTPKEIIKPLTGSNNNPVITPPSTSNCSPDTVYFQNTIMKIINSNCNGQGCHNAIDKRDGVNLSDYAHIMKYIKNGDLMDKITKTNPKDVMPPPPAIPLDQTSINLIKKWIAQGAKNNYCNEGCDSTKYSYGTDLSIIITSNCGGANSSCHFSGSATTKLGSYAELKALGMNQKLMGALNHTSGYQPMPSSTLKLSTCDTKKFQKWIDSGYPQ